MHSLRIIYTFYATQDTEAQVVDFVENNDIDAVTMPEYKVNQNFVSQSEVVRVPLPTCTPSMILNRWLTMKMGRVRGLLRCVDRKQELDQME